MLGRIFSPVDQQDALAAHYPLSPARFSHLLAGHPLLSLEALAEAALTMRPADVERRVSDGGIGSSFSKLQDGLPAIDRHIRTIAENPCWIMLAHIGQIPEYAALLDAVLEAARPVVASKTGAFLNPTGFIFISAKGSVTPLHFDPEYNLFFQIAGHKRFVTFPPGAPMMTDEVNEHYHCEGDNMLRWEESFAALGTQHDLEPGDGLYVPYKSPHWVKVHDGLSISLSVTWKSDWSLAQESGHRCNARLRRWGMKPRSLPPWPMLSQSKRIGGQLLDRMGLGR